MTSHLITDYVVTENPFLSTSATPESGLEARLKLTHTCYVLECLPVCEEHAMHVSAAHEAEHSAVDASDEAGMSDPSDTLPVGPMDMPGGLYFKWF